MNARRRYNRPPRATTRQGAPYALWLAALVLAMFREKSTEQQKTLLERLAKFAELSAGEDPAKVRALFAHGVRKVRGEPNVKGEMIFDEMTRSVVFRIRSKARGATGEVRI